jgi:hypothetical protein
VLGGRACFGGARVGSGEFEPWPLRGAWRVAARRVRPPVCDAVQPTRSGIGVSRVSRMLRIPAAHIAEGLLRS